MKTSWVQGLEKEQATDVTQSFKESTVMRKRLMVLIQQEVDEIRKSARSAVNYDNPSWAYTQADKLGYERALFKVLGLLEE